MAVEEGGRGESRDDEGGEGVHGGDEMREEERERYHLHLRLTSPSHQHSLRLADYRGPACLWLGGYCKIRDNF